MSVNTILQDIANKKLSPVYFIHGEEPYFIDQIINAADSILPEAEKSFNQVTLYGKDTDFKQVVDQASQYPMMSPYRVIILKEAQFMSDFDKLQRYFEKPSPMTCLFVGYKKKADGRKKVFAQLKKSAVYLESEKIPDYKIAEWISNYFRQHKRLIHPDNAQRLSDLLGNQLGKVINELEKLRVVTADGNEITQALIDANVGLSKDFNIFEFQNAISSKDMGKAMQIAMYFGENEKENPVPLILGGMYSYFSKVYTAKAHLTLDDKGLAMKLKVFSPNVARTYKAAAKNYSVQQLKNAFNALLLADMSFKGMGMRSAKPTEILQDMVFSIFYGSDELIEM